MDECHQALQKLLNVDDLDEVFNSIPTPDDCDVNHFLIMVMLFCSFFLSNLFYFPVRDGSHLFRIVSVVLKGKEDRGGLMPWLLKRLMYAGLQSSRQ
jgi:hypothetical protein